MTFTTDFYKRPATPEEKKAFAEAFYFFENYVKVPAPGCDKMTQENYFRRMMADAEKIAADEKNELLSALLLGISNYYNDIAMGKIK